MISPGLGKKSRLSAGCKTDKRTDEMLHSHLALASEGGGGKKEGLVHLDVNGSALSTVPQLKFNEASPFCSTGSFRCYWFSVLSSTASFPDND